jgi:Uma2 family endonuclease
MTNGLYTFDDLVHTPDDGQRYEVIDGSLVVTPMAGAEHQPLVGLLFEQIFRASSPDLVVLPGAQLHLGTDAPIPDLVVVRDQASLPAAFTAADVVLVVEVVGPGQRERDG